MPLPRNLERWILVALGAVCAASVAAWLARFGWPFELFSHFRPQLAVAAALLVPALLLVRARRAALLAVVVSALQFAAGAHGLGAAESAPACSGEPLVVVTANVEFTNHETGRLLEWLAAQQPDVVVLQEVTPEWAAALAQLAEFPYVRLVPRRDPYGLALLSRWPFDSIAPVDLAGDGIPSFEAVVRVRDQSVHVLGLHTRWPITPALARSRDRALDNAARLARASALPTLAVGDLNLTPDSPAYARLLQQSGLRDVLAGQGWQPTWMAGFWPLALRIDHQLASPALCVEHAQVGPDIGSDHRPLIARYRLPATRPARG
ncbi:MAG TPA: endonuclease/exonuclease/phosphatase family protein [Steroidobacteraceae bacterium]